MKLIFLFVIVVALSYSKQSNSSLKLVHVFFRHGSRTPDKQELSSNDKHFKYFEEMGFGQLTKDGREGAYQLGNILYNRYHKFLGDNYSTDMVYTRSTNRSRTKNSAILLLAGLFPSLNIEEYNDDFKSNAIPYQYEKFSTDYELGLPARYCPAFRKELRNVLKSNEIRNIVKRHELCFNITNRYTRSNTTLQQMISLYNMFNIKSSMNMSLPLGSNSGFLAEIGYLASLYLNAENYNPVLKRLNGGRMVKMVVKNMKNKVKNLLSPPERKIYLYSGHEYNLSYVLNILNVSINENIPDFSSAIVIELHRHSRTGQHFIKVFYIKNPYSVFEELHVEGCGPMCYLKTFIHIMEPYLPNNYTKECRSSVLLRN